MTTEVPFDSGVAHANRTSDQDKSDSAPQTNREHLAPDPPPSPVETQPKRPRGFAAMDRKLVSDIASKGGKAAHFAGTAHKFSSDEARVAGRKGGRAMHAIRRATVREPDTSAGAAEPSTTQRTEAVAPPFSPPRLLVAGEDNDEGRRVADALRADGYEVVQVTDVGRLLVAVAHEFLAIPRQAFIGLVVSDSQTPMRAWIRILEQIRIADWRMPVIFLTGPSNTATREEAAELGALIFHQPLDVGALRSAVARFPRPRPGLELAPAATK